MTKQIPYDLIPASDLPRSTPGAFDSVVGVDESTGAARRFPMPSAGSPRAYETLADLPASASEGTAAYVNNDPTPENNGLWAYLDGAWVKSADRFTGMEGRLVTAEQDVAGLKDFRVEARIGFDHTAEELIRLRDYVPAGSVGFVWGVTDEDDRLLIGADEEGLIHGKLKDPMGGDAAPVDESGMAVEFTDEDDRFLFGVAKDGSLQFTPPAENFFHDAPESGDGLALAVLDSDDRLMFGVDKFGNFVAQGFEATQRVSPDVYDVVGGDLYSTGARGRELVAQGGDYPFRAAVGIPGGASASQQRPMIGADRRVAVSPDGLMVPDAPGLVTHIIGYGQSLSVGAKGLPLISTSNPYPDSVLMFAGLDVRAGLSANSQTDVLDPETLIGFEPLVAKVSPASGRGQTHLESLGAAIVSRSDAATGVRPRLLMSTHGVGATPYSGLKKGTVPYSNLLAAVAKSKQLAEAQGWAYWVPCLCVMHGEGDASNPDYFDHLAEWQPDIDADIRAITGQQAPVQFYMGQPSSFYGSGAGTSAARAVYRAAKELPGFTIVAPQYTLSYDPDLTHMDGPGYFRMGEYFAKAVLAEQFGVGRWSAVRPRTVTWDNATQIDIEFHAPVGPLVLDTTLVSDPGNYGFEFVDDSASASIASVQLIGADVVRVTLDGTPTGLNKRIRYALNGYNGGKDPATAPRGCLRDSDPAMSALGGNLYNWCLHFEEPIE